MGFFLDNSLQGKMALLMNSALFDFGAPNEDQLKAQIDFINAKSFPNDIFAFEFLVSATLDPANGFFSTPPVMDDVINDFYQNVFGRPATASELAFFNLNYPDDPAIALANLIVQSATDPALTNELDSFLANADAGTAIFDAPVFGDPILEAPTDVLIDGADTDDIDEHPLADGDSVGILTAEDQDGDTHTFEFADGTDPAITDAFEIVGDELLVKNASLIDFEDTDSYSIDIKATDQSGNNAVHTITVDINDVNPEDILIDNTEIAESEAAGAVVGNLTADDDEANGPYTFTLVESDGPFSIVGNQLVLSGPVDFETATSHEVKIEVADKFGEVTEQTFTIDVTDVDPMGTQANGSIIANVDEELPAGTIVAALTAVDDSNGPHTFAITGGADQADFDIVGTNLVTTRTFDFEGGDVGPAFLEIEVTDATGETATSTILVAINDIEEAGITQAFTIGGDALEGTDGADMFVGGTDFVSVLSTANSGDSADGGLGVDTVKLSLDDSTQTLDGLTLTNIENVRINSNTNGPARSTATNWWEGTLLAAPMLEIIDGKGGVAVENIRSAFLDNDGVVKITNQTDDVQLDFNADESDGKKLNIVLDNVGEAGGNNGIDIMISEDDLNGGADASQLDEVMITSTNTSDGGPNYIDDFGGGDSSPGGGFVANTNIRKLTVDGDADINFGDENSQNDDLLSDNTGLQEVDMSGLSGDSYVNLADDSGAHTARNIKFTGGTGDDDVEMGTLFADGANGGQAFDGNDGYDRMLFEDFNQVGPSDAASSFVGLPGSMPDMNVVSNFEEAYFRDDVGGAQNSTDAVLDMSQLDGIRTINLSDGFNGGPANWIQIEELEMDQEHTVIIGNDNATIINASFTVEGDGTSDSVVLDLDDPLLDINLSGPEIEKFTFDQTTGGMNDIQLIGPDLVDLKEVVLTGDGAEFEFDADGLAPNLETYNGGSSDAMQNVFGLTNGASVTTGEGDDRVIGSDEKDVINTNGGRDRVEGRDGDDEINTGDDNDVALGGDGNDRIDTGDGRDLASGGDGDDIIFLGAGNDSGGGVDFGPWSGFGGAGGVGGAGNDQIDGGSGRDFLAGERGDDKLLGGTGNDFLVGGTGNDILDGGTGADEMVGDAGPDSPTIKKATVEGFVGQGDEYTINISTPDNMVVDISVTVTAAAGDSASDIADKLEAALTAFPLPAGFSAVANGPDVIVTELDGTGFGLMATATDGAFEEIPIADTENVIIDNTPDSYDAGDVVTFTIDDPINGPTAYTYVVAADGETANDVAQELADLVNAGPQMTAVVNDNVIEMTGVNPTLDYVTSLASTTNVAPVENVYTFTFDGINLADTLVLSTPFGVFQETRNVLEPDQNVMNDFITNHGPAINAATGGTLSGIDIIDNGDDFQLILTGPADGSPLAVDIADLIFTIGNDNNNNGTVLAVEQEGDQVNPNGNPVLDLAGPAGTAVDENSQAMSTMVIDEGEPAGADLFIVDSPDVDPFGGLTGFLIDTIIDFDSMEGDTIAFEDGVAGSGTNFQDLGMLNLNNYDDAFSIANAVMGTSTNLDYLLLETTVDGVFLFADTNGDNSVDQAVAVNTDQITSADIVADTDPQII